MDILSFALGVISILIILGVIYIITLKSSVKNLTKKYETHDELISNLQSKINENSRLDNTRIDGEIDRVNRIFSDLSTQVTTLDSNVNRKLQVINERLETIQNEGCDPVIKEKKKKKKVL